MTQTFNNCFQSEYIFIFNLQFYFKKKFKELVCSYMHSWILPLSNTQVGKRVLLYIVIKEHCTYRIYGVNRFIEPISISPLLPH